MNVVLANLPWKKGKFWGVRAGSRWPHLRTALEKDYSPFPFFLAYAAALLKREGFAVRVVDACAERIPRAAFLRMISEERPGLVVVETSTPSLENDLQIINALPAGVRVALCGPEATSRTADFLLRNKRIDYVMVGEYEYTLLELCRHLTRGQDLADIGGLIYRSGDGVRVNPPGTLIPSLDLLPWPLREGLPMDAYNDTPGGIPAPSVQMWASRGCPYQCLFCLWPQMMYQRGRYRVRSVKDVVDEMEFLVREKGFRSVYFDDDTFNVGKQRMKEFAREIISRKLTVPWAVMARADLFDEEVLLALRQAGLAAVKYGVESAEQSLVDNCRKSMDLSQVERVVGFTKKIGIKVHLTFTFGLPGETWSTVRKTIAFARKLDPDSAQFSVTTAFPGTHFFSLLEERGHIASYDFKDYDGNASAVIRTDCLGAGDLLRAKRTAERCWFVHVLMRRWKNSGVTGSLAGLWRFFARMSMPALHERAAQLFSCGFDRLRRLGGWQAKGCAYLFAHGPGRSWRKAAHTYRDLLGVFQGAYAYKGPDCVQIDLTSNCNNNCIGCWCNSPLLGARAYSGVRKVATLPAELVRSLVDELAGMGTKEIYFSGGGEPLMHPDLLSLLEYSKQLGLACTLHTNFTLADEMTVKRLIDMGIDQLTVSVWAGTPRTYAATHPNKSETAFYRLRDMLCMLNSLKRAGRPYTKIYHVVSSLNCEELEMMAAFARDTKSDAVEFTVIDTIPGATDVLALSRQQRARVLEQCEQLKSSPDGLHLHNLDNFSRRIADPGAESALYERGFIETMPCYVGWLFARIMPDGNVNSCLKSHRFPVGNLYERSFRQIWNSREQIHFRQKTNRAAKDDPFFALIGNDPECKVGCYKSCDDLGRNVRMFNLVNSLTPFERFILRSCARFLKPEILR